MNRSIGDGKLAAKGNKPKISPGGKLVRELLKEGEFILANNLEKAMGGPSTWICRVDGAVKSCLDLVIISADLEPYLSSLVIDTKFKYAPFRVKKEKQKDFLFSHKVWGGLSKIDLQTLQQNDQERELSSRLCLNSSLPIVET